MIRVRKIDHLVLRSNNVPAMVRFYREVLGCEVESELGRAGGGPPGPANNNLDHFCLELEDTGEKELRAWLKSQGVDCGEFETRYGAGGFGSSIYIKDPDGNTVELRPGNP
jgi:glyoxylase I family protein